jgi:hypothetical protein
MKRSTIIPAAVVLLAASSFAAGKPDAKASVIAQNMLNAMGGQDAWNRAHFVRYDFIVTANGNTVASRSHLWDKQTGRYRLEDKTKDGKSRVVLFNAANQQGDTYVDGKKVDGSASAEAVKDAYKAFINDMYWLAMPWKWMDQGVHLKYLGPRARNNRNFDVVELSFDHVGLTPGDRYLAFVSPRSSLMEHWEYTLESGTKGSWDWEYATTGGVKLASNHKSADGTSTINMGAVRVVDSVDDAYFTDQSKALSGLK